MKVSVIVSTYSVERFSDVIRCLNSIEEQTLKPHEVLLVLDPVDSLVKFYRENVKNARIVVSDSFGLSVARNKGIMESSGEILAFIDDDAWAEKDWLEKIARNFRDERVFGVGGKIVPIFDSRRPRWLGEELDWIVGCTYRGMKEGEIRNPIGANMAFRRDAFKIAGYFRTEMGRYGKKLLGGEEAEFSLRLKKLKPDAKIVFDSSAVVYHRVPADRCKFKYALRRAYYEGISKSILERDFELRGEKEYLKFLLKSLPLHILRGKFIRSFGIFSTISSTMVGYFFAKISRIYKN
jgi:glycosyltransferase involved in cell wall biosynthesis